MSFGLGFQDNWDRIQCGGRCCLGETLHDGPGYGRPPRVEPHTARGGWKAQRGLGRVRRVEECTLAWVGQFRRLRIRCERRAEIHETFLTIGCALIRPDFMQPGFCKCSYVE